ncbi:uncharacterized protein BJX67DRAFT_309544 [Aspergillus lucknowensis]|uniref:Uncharacterized protein n=1 Tax=Aspergillus lucknowensis TaxID=176173 RepID=A0ABR4LCJ9_9EURO
MPRTVPWLTGVIKSRKDSDSPTPQIKRTSSPRVKNETPSKRETPPSKRDFFRSSPSPPSSPVHRCPSEEFLNEGLDGDDIYIMVEDEFYTVAQSFTKHLHYAEYVRRGREAKARNAAKIEDIARPTNGTTDMSDELKKKYAAEDLKASQKKGLDRIYGNGSRESYERETPQDDVDEENSWAGTHLQDLMLSPRRARLLVGKTGVRSTTRAAAGFAQANGTGKGGLTDGDRVAEDEVETSLPCETTDEDDDLDAVALRPVSAVARPAAAVRRSSSVMSRRNHITADLESRSLSGAVHPTEDTTKQVRVTQSGNTPTTTQAKRRLIFDDFGELPEKPQVADPENKPSATTRTKKRLIFDDFDELPEPPRPSVQPQERRSGFTNAQWVKHKDKDAGAKKSRLNEVPTFLI